MRPEKFCRGQIYYVYPGKATGSEQGGGRPAIIVSNDLCNEYSKVVEVVFLTTKQKVQLPTHVVINSARRRSIALCEQIESVDKTRIGNYMGKVTPDELNELEKAMLVSLQITADLRWLKALSEWEKTTENHKCVTRYAGG